MSATESIPLGEAALCVTCEILFNVRNRSCPKCGSDLSFYLITKTRQPKLEEEKKP